jgi:hypothetical protein
MAGRGERIVLPQDAHLSDDETVAKIGHPNLLSVRSRPPVTVLKMIEIGPNRRFLEYVCRGGEVDGHINYPQNGIIISRCAAIVFPNEDEL